MNGAGMASPVYGDRMADNAGTSAASPPPTFGALIRNGRLAMGWTQEQTVAAVQEELAGYPDLPIDLKFSVSTSRRWEADDISNPRPQLVRALCTVLRISPVAATIALGYITTAEVNQDPQPLVPVDPQLAKIQRVLSDPIFAMGAKELLRRGVQAAFDLWLGAYRMQSPVEPSTEERLGRGRQSPSRHRPPA